MEKKQEEFEAAETVEDVTDESVCEDAAEKAAEEETAENGIFKEEQVHE